jgi:trehalose/maltose hydrolase-like predicted phosphorylase
MIPPLEPTQNPGWVLSHEGYDILTESALESRLAFGNGFLGMRAAQRAKSRSIASTGFGGAGTY